MQMILPSVQISSHHLYYIIILIIEMPTLRKGDAGLKKRPDRKEHAESGTRQKRNKGKAQSKKRFGYWRNSQQIKYLSFLRSNFLIMKSAYLRTEFQIFKKMSNHVRSRDAIQCKSHHQKMLMKNNNRLQSILQEKITSTNTQPQFIYRQQRNDKLMSEHVNKIQTDEELPYFIIKEPNRLLIVIDQRFMITY